MKIISKSGNRYLIIVSGAGSKEGSAPPRELTMAQMLSQKAGVLDMETKTMSELQPLQEFFKFGEWPDYAPEPGEMALLFQQLAESQ